VLEHGEVLITNVKRGWAVLGLVATAAAVASTAAVASHRAATTIVIWTDQDRAAAVTKVANDWAAASKAKIKVVTKNFGDIRDGLATVSAGEAPDVITAAHDWTGQLAVKGLVEPLNPTKAVRARFPSYTLDAFSYGTAVKKLYGIPVSIENIGLVVNTKLAPPPKTFAQLETTALRLKKKFRQSFGICVQQGAGGDAYHMYPFFSGLGGYVFGRNHAGNLDPSDIGVANAAFLKNAPLVDKWNKEGLINSSADYSTCLNAFTKGNTPYWITGPWAADTIQKSGVQFKVVQLPAIVKPSVPLLGVQGMMVTKFATAHNVDAAAKDLVTTFLASASSQTQLAAANGRPPASNEAKSANTVLAQFSLAGKDGVPIPNIPQMGSVWPDLGLAWARSTKGAGATPAAASFRAAKRSIANKIG
jgi:maltose-binding protein MalE